MKNFVKEGQKLPLYGVGPYIVYGMAGVTIAAICFDGENQKGVDKSNKIVQKTDNGTKIYFPIEDSRACLPPGGIASKKVIERPFPYYAKKSREISFKWKFVLSLGMKMGMVKIIDVSF